MRIQIYITEVKNILHTPWLGLRPGFSLPPPSTTCASNSTLPHYRNSSTTNLLQTAPLLLTLLTSGYKLACNLCFLPTPPKPRASSPPHQDLFTLSISHPYPISFIPNSIGTLLNLWIYMQLIYKKKRS